MGRGEEVRALPLLSRAAFLPAPLGMPGGPVEVRSQSCCPSCVQRGGDRAVGDGQHGGGEERGSDGFCTEGSGQCSIQRCPVAPPGGPGIGWAALGGACRCSAACRCPLDRSPAAPLLARRSPAADKHYAMAQQLYSKAIEADPTSAVLWANRAFAAIRLEVGAPAEERQRLPAC